MLWVWRLCFGCGQNSYHFSRYEAAAFLVRFFLKRMFPLYYSLGYSLYYYVEVFFRGGRN